MSCQTATVCHPEPKAKDLAHVREVSHIRSPDPSLHYAPFRMTNREPGLVRVESKGETLTCP